MEPITVTLLDSQTILGVKTLGKTAAVMVSDSIHQNHQNAQFYILYETLHILYILYILLSFAH